MKILDIRRHAMRQKPSQHLSQDGIELARQVGARLGPYDAVLTSNLARAIETAVAMGFSVSNTSEELGLYPEALPERIAWPSSLENISNHLARFHEYQALAARQLVSWRSILPQVREGGAGLVVTHGALLEIGTIALLKEIEMPIEGAAFAYCEGLRIHVDSEVVKTVEFIRLPEQQRLISN